VEDMLMGHLPHLQTTIEPASAVSHEPSAGGG
jgi:hypothetical protein